MHYEAIDARIQWLNLIDAVKCRSIDRLPAALLCSVDDVCLSCRPALGAARAEKQEIAGACGGQQY